MRWGTAQAVHHARHRSAFGAPLAEQPLMRNVLADLARRVRGRDGHRDARGARLRRGPNAPFRRLATAVSKYWVCKRAPVHAAEALECLGGNGYVEESGMPRLLRDSPLNSIWEGSGNVAALDVLRVMAKEPEALPAFMAELEQARGERRALRRAPGQAPRQPGDRPPVAGPPAGRGPGARAPGAVCWCVTRPRRCPTAFCASRLHGNGGGVFGTLPKEVDAEPIVERALAA